MENEKKSPFRVVHFPEKLNREDILCRSILQLGPVLNARVELHKYVEDALKEIVKNKGGIPHHSPLDQLVVPFNPDYRSGQNEKEYDQWINNQIRYHAVPVSGRVTLLIIPRACGEISDSLRGYAKHTGSELSRITANREYKKSSIVVCIEKGAPEEAYYTNNLELDCPDLSIHSSMDKAIEEAYLLATFDAYITSPRVDLETLIQQST